MLDEMDAQRMMLIPEEDGNQLACHTARLEVIKLRPWRTCCFDIDMVGNCSDPSCVLIKLS